VQRERNCRRGWRGASFTIYSSRSWSRQGCGPGETGSSRSLRKRDLLLEPVAAEYPRTTQSYHTLPVFTNSIKDLEVTGPNQVWVSDITYVRTAEGYLFLSLITDRWSRKIVGHYCGDSLETQGCLQALDLALRLPCLKGPDQFTIRIAARSIALICM